MALHEHGDIGTELTASPDIGAVGIDGGPRLRTGQELGVAEGRRVADLMRANADLREANARLERANRELWRENALLARGLMGRSESAAGTYLMHAENARAEAARLEALISTPRHQAVERMRDAVMRSPFLYEIVRRLWSWLGRR